jgi:hypothetical protein
MPKRPRSVPARAVKLLDEIISDYPVRRSAAALVFRLSVCISLPGRVFADDATNNGQDFTRPPAQHDFRYLFQDQGDDLWRDTFTLRVNRPFPLGDGWEIGTRLDLPFVLTNKSSKDNPEGKDTFGLGDVPSNQSRVIRQNLLW